MTLTRQYNSRRNEEFPIIHDISSSISENAENVDAEVASFMSKMSMSEGSFLRRSSSTSMIPQKLKISFKKTGSEDSISSIASLSTTRHPRRRTYQERQKSCLKRLNASGNVRNPFLSRN
eukprot:CAMPEP_0172307018 /NCGR_PEP_ID=MMETSP1058-20130122/7963_1 /TAXON_ID=83371 /ORGANISM="Detonula confervacea, Strain CCMP 353" /LENGTH=119 /DNA_ID=CAMNT_0013019079 /DNA_START=126 /DNA_END=485 /DNA_ORIENTATION=+